MEADLATTVELYVEAATSGDSAELDAFLAESDDSGEISAILAAGLADGASRRWGSAISEAPPPFADDQYADGDILLFSGTERWQSQALNLILINAYGHAGIVQKSMTETATEFTAENPSVVSATLPEGVRYQTYEELFEDNDAWAQMRVTEAGAELAAGWGGAFTDAYPEEDTYYAFLKLDLSPISREDPVWWYCSKVPYRVWRDYRPTGNESIEIEDTSLYTGTVYAAQRQSILYKLYTAYYRKLPWWLRWRARTPDEVLTAALTELITPDELRTADTVALVETWGATRPEDTLVLWDVVP